MSAKNVDKHNRFRSITVGFRVSPEENEELNRAVALSGLPKQEYCYRKVYGARGRGTAKSQGLQGAQKPNGSNSYGTGTNCSRRLCC